MRSCCCAACIMNVCCDAVFVVVHPHGTLLQLISIAPPHRYIIETHHSTWVDYRRVILILSIPTRRPHTRPLLPQNTCVSSLTNTLIQAHSGSYTLDAVDVLSMCSHCCRVHELTRSCCCCCVCRVRVVASHRLSQNTAHTAHSTGNQSHKHVRVWFNCAMLVVLLHVVSLSPNSRARSLNTLSLPLLLTHSLTHAHHTYTYTQANWLPHH